MYLMVQNCQYDRFDTIVNFLHELYLIAPTLIPEKLYDRVMATVKSLVISITLCLIYYKHIIIAGPSLSTFMNVYEPET